jgi:hypothetical protein
VHPNQESFEEIEALDLTNEVSIILGVKQHIGVARIVLDPRCIKISGTLYIE